MKICKERAAHMDYSHFISLPLSCNAPLVDVLEKHLFPTMAEEFVDEEGIVALVVLFKLFWRQICSSF